MTRTKRRPISWSMPKSSAMSECINCKRWRRCLLIQACTPDPPGWEIAASITICRSCLRDDFGTLSGYFAAWAR